MPDRVRRVSQRASTFAILALLAFAAAGPSAVLAEQPQLIAPADRPIARDQKPADTSGYRLPFAPGLDVKIHQGWNSKFSHKGRQGFAYDFGLQEGTPVLAAAGGVVAWTHDGESECGGWELKRDVNYVTIYHPDGSATHYGHLAKVGVEVGQVVAAGQKIGLSGKTGYTGCLPHLHFARQEQGAPVTRSLPVYFDAYPGEELQDGATVEAGMPACTATEPRAMLAGGAADDGAASPEGTEAEAPAFCVTYAPLAEGSAPYFTRPEAAIDFDWAEGPPGGYWLDDATAGFRLTWSGEIVVEGGMYAIHVDATDDVLVSIDGLNVFDYASEDPEPQSFERSWPLVPGAHQVVIEHLDPFGNGILRFDWQPLVTANGRWSRCGPLNSADC